jgi:hypothetical protein
MRSLEPAGEHEHVKPSIVPSPTKNVITCNDNISGSIRNIREDKYLRNFTTLSDGTLMLFISDDNPL